MDIFQQTARLESLHSHYQHCIDYTTLLRKKFTFAVRRRPKAKGGKSISRARNIHHGKSFHVAEGRQEHKIRSAKQQKAERRCVKGLQESICIISFQSRWVDVTLLGASSNCRLASLSLPVRLGYIFILRGNYAHSLPFLLCWVDAGGNGTCRLKITKIFLVD